MDRRAFLGALASGFLAAPLAASAQEVRKIYRIGLLSAGSLREDLPKISRGCSSKGSTTWGMPTAKTLSWSTAGQRTPGSVAGARGRVGASTCGYHRDGRHTGDEGRETGDPDK